MLARNSYPQEYIDACRARIDAQLAAYDALRQDAALERFGEPFFQNLVLVLDASFAHRQRGREGKDGNPMNEVRLLSTSILDHDAVLVADKQIRLPPETSILGYAPGDRIAPDREGFERLADGFFARIQETFGPGA
jgi:hypothetical protein